MNEVTPSSHKQAGSTIKSCLDHAAPEYTCYYTLLPFQLNCIYISQPLLFLYYVKQKYRLINPDVVELV